jgi:hypothetical protein
MAMDPAQGPATRRITVNKIGAQNYYVCYAVLFAANSACLFGLFSSDSESGLPNTQRHVPEDTLRIGVADNNGDFQRYSLLTRFDKSDSEEPVKLMSVIESDDGHVALWE